MNDHMAVLAQFLDEQVLFNAFLGMRVVELRPGFARMVLPYRRELTGDPQRPALHGGVMSALIDTCGGAAVWSQVEADDRVATVDLRVDFLRPAPLEDLGCDARVLRLGNRVGVAEMTLYATNAPDVTVSSGKAVYNIKRGE